MAHFRKGTAVSDCIVSDAIMEIIVRGDSVDAHVAVLLLTFEPDLVSFQG